MNKSVHPVDERLPLGQTFLYGLQHVLAMYAGAVAVPLIVANAIGLSTEDLIYLINDGMRVRTSYRDSKKLLWVNGSKVYVYQANGKEHLRTISDSTELDNLDNLPTF